MLFIIVVCITVRVMEFLNLQCRVHYWFNWPANNLYFVLFTFFTVWAGFSLQAVETTYSKLLNKIPSDNSSLWDRNNKTHCLAVVKRDIHHVGAWQQWLVGVLFWLNTEPIKCYSLTSYTERDSNNPLDQSKVLSKLLRLFFIISALITQSQWRKDMKDGNTEMCVTWHKDSVLSSVCQSNEQPGSLPKSGIVI